MKLEKMCMVYVIYPNKKEAQSAIKLLLKEKLIVCGNIIPGVESIYTWKGQLESAKECIALLKTSSKLAAQVKKRVLKIHSYETPFTAKINLDSVNENYVRYAIKNLK